MPSGEHGHCGQHGTLMDEVFTGKLRQVQHQNQHVQHSKTRSRQLFQDDGVSPGILGGVERIISSTNQGLERV